MSTVYDFVTVACFGCASLTYFMFTDREMKTLAHFMVPAVVFMIANQVGNRAHADLGLNALAIVLIAAGIVYTYIIVRH